MQHVDQQPQHQRLPEESNGSLNGALNGALDLNGSGSATEIKLQRHAPLTPLPPPARPLQRELSVEFDLSVEFAAMPQPKPGFRLSSRMYRSLMQHGLFEKLTDAGDERARRLDEVEEVLSALEATTHALAAVRAHSDLPPLLALFEALHDSFLRRKLRAEQAMHNEASCNEEAFLSFCRLVSAYAPLFGRESPAVAGDAHDRPRALRFVRFVSGSQSPDYQASRVRLRPIRRSLSSFQ